MGESTGLRLEFCVYKCKAPPIFLGLFESKNKFLIGFVFGMIGYNK